MQGESIGISLATNCLGLRHGEARLFPMLDAELTT